jgi:ribosomal protein L37E
MVILMVAILLLPSIVKLEHHHDHFVCKAKTEKHYHNHHEKCQVCSFEFSSFMSEAFFVLPAKQVSFGVFTSNYKAGNFSNTFDYTFLLRAPPTCRC